LSLLFLDCTGLSSLLRHFGSFQLVKLEIGRADLMQWNNKGFNYFGETLRRLPQTLSLSTLRGGEGSHLNRFLPLSTRVMTCALIAGLHPSTPSDKMSFPVAVLASARVPSEVGVKAGKSQVRAEEVCFRAERGELFPVSLVYSTEDCHFRSPGYQS